MKPDEQKTEEAEDMLCEIKNQLAKSKGLDEWPAWEKVPYNKWWIVSGMLDEVAFIYAASLQKQVDELRDLLKTSYYLIETRSHPTDEFKETVKKAITRKED